MVNGDAGISTLSAQNEGALKETELSDIYRMRPFSVQGNAPLSFSKRRFSLRETYFQTNGKSYAASVTT